ncbi:MAG: polysaccharide biosynthesis protein [Firmicutes bacterium]|nr:polysaccharide biosynthesis protein [Bacillota bacterium]
MKKTFMKGAVILGIAGLIIKALGAFFRIPLANIIGDTGMGYYQTAYPVYVLLLTLSTAGIPTAIARLVSERTAEENHIEAYRIFKISFALLLGIGFISCAILFFGAPLIVSVVSDMPNTVYAMRATAPALLFVPMMAAFRGYFQGLQNMTPTAVSQIMEQLFRVASGLILAIALLPAGLYYAAAGASFGATAGSIFGLAAIFIIFIRRRPGIRQSLENSVKDGAREDAGHIIRKIIIIAIPITIGAAIMPIMNNLDLAIVMRRLAAAGFTAKEANDLYGQLSGFATPIINFPQVLTQSIAMSLVPAIAAAYKTKDISFMRRNIELGMRTAMLIGWPCAVGIFVLAKPIMLLLYPTQHESAVSASGCLAILAVGVIFLSSVQTLTGILQGAGRQMIPVVNLLIGAIFKIAITYWLTGIASINVKGAAVGTVCAYLVASILNLIAVKKYTGAAFDLSLTYIKPIVSSVGMGVAVWIVYKLINMICGNAVSTLISVCCGVIVYGILIFMFKGITDEELKLLPKGKKIAAVFSRIKK